MRNESVAYYRLKAEQCRRLAQNLFAWDSTCQALLSLAEEFEATAAQVAVPRPQPDQQPVG